MVGGYLRDLLRTNGALPEAGRPLDLDIAVPCQGQALARLGSQLAARLNGACVNLNPTHNICRVIAKSDRGAAGSVGGAQQQQLTIDLTGYSAERPVEDDLARRDFTINAMALPLSQWPAGAAGGWADAVIDPYGGRADLAHGRIRAVSEGVFRADPGRLLRGVSLTGRLKFRIAPETAALIRANAPLLEQVAPERVKDQLLLILAGDGAKGRLEALDRLDLLCRIIPELALTKGVEQPSAHYWDVWNHLLHTVEYAEMAARGHQHSAVYSLVPWTEETADYFAREISAGYTRQTNLKLAALLHDLAKPQTRAPDAAGRIRFPGHSELGEEMARQRLTQLRFSFRAVNLVGRMVRHHLRPTQLRNATNEPSLRAIHRYYRELGEAAIDTIYLALADYLAARGPNIIANHWAEHARMLTYVLQVGPQPAPAKGSARLITGHDLMGDLGLPPGPQLGRLLEQIDEARAAGEVTSRQEALTLARGLLQK